MKKVTLKPKPQTASRDEWVNAGAKVESAEISPPPASLPGDSTSQREADNTATVPMKRLTIDIPSDLHTRVKMQCAARGRKMADEIRVLLEERFSPEPSAE